MAGTTATTITTLTSFQVAGPPPTFNHQIIPSDLLALIGDYSSDYGDLNNVRHSWFHNSCEQMPQFPKAWVKKHIYSQFAQHHKIGPDFWLWLQQFGLLAGGSIYRALLCDRVATTWDAKESDLDIFVCEDMFWQASLEFVKRFSKEVGRNSTSDDQEKTKEFIGNHTVAKYGIATLNGISGVCTLSWCGHPKTIQIIGIKKSSSTVFTEKPIKPVAFVW